MYVWYREQASKHTRFQYYVPKWTFQGRVLLVCSVWSHRLIRTWKGWPNWTKTLVISILFPSISSDEKHLTPSFVTVCVASCCSHITPHVFLLTLSCFYFHFLLFLLVKISSPIIWSLRGLLELWPAIPWLARVFLPLLLCMIVCYVCFVDDFMYFSVCCVCEWLSHTLSKIEHS